jgi:polyvinyl alcohol dehydrogenase (cytochrome)
VHQKEEYSALKTQFVCTRFGRLALVAALLLCVGAATAVAQEPADGAKVFNGLCVNCHKDGSPTQAPLPEVLRKMPADTILAALTDGKMKAIASRLTDGERLAVAKFLGTASTGEMPQTAYCSSPMSLMKNAPSWTAFGIDLTNSRYQSAEAAGLTADTVPRLKLKWAFGFPGVTTSFGTPTVYGGRVMMGSADGNVYALDAKSGCIRWRFKASEGVRAGMSVSPDGGTLYLADLHAYVYALQTETGELLWKQHLDDHPLAIITGAPRLVDGKLYVPISAGEEEVNAGDPMYKCCTLRGSMVSLDAKDGKILWKTYTIPEEPKLIGHTSNGTEMWSPNGSSPWSTPTVDTKKSLLYTGTGVNFREPSTKYSDSIVAFDMKTGKIAWGHQYLANDVFNFGCLVPDKANCPPKPGINQDIGVSPILKPLGKGRILVFGQKNGLVYGVDPDKQGKIIWQTRVSKGGLQGGLIWGSAADDKNAYYSISDWDPMHPEAGGGVVAVEIATGKIVWQTPAPKPDCLGTKGCSAGQPGAVALIPGVVFATSLDGHLRGYSTTDGKIIWDFNTLKDFDTVNGVKARGGSMNGTGPVVAGGMLYSNSGYSRNPVMPGNVFLAFSVDGN